MCTVVYNASPGFPALEVIEFLRARGLSPQTLDDPNPDPAVMYASAQTCIVRIAVPYGEMARALHLLQAREAGRDVLIKRATAQLRWQVALGFGIAVAIAACILYARAWPGSYVLEDLMIAGIGVIIGGGVATVIIAQVTERLTRRETVDAPRCHACEYILLGLTEPRCPECGYPFDPRMLALNDDALPEYETEPEETSEP